jgi:phenylpropionate dioxygenase-like ring-hydroxylating dioxygenase large terminal subunit
MLNFRSGLAPAPTGSDFGAVERELTQASHAPGGYYSSPGFFQQELNRSFLRDWLFVARAEELPNAGDYLTLSIADQPIVVTRKATGELSTFCNMCAHRGAEVASGRGNTRDFKCPYHGWTYDIEGRLISAPFMRESDGFNAEACRLKPLRSAVWDSNLFVSFNPDPPDFATTIERLAHEFGVFRMHDCRTAHRIVTELDCNWKLAVENLMDYYHVGVLHAKTFGHRVNWQSGAVSLFKDGGYHMWYTGQASTPNGKALLGSFPWLADKPEGFSCVACFPPNLCIFARFDCVKLSSVLPRGHDRCSLITYHLFPAEFFALPNFEDVRKIYETYQIEIFEEDRSMIESLQRAMASPIFVPGRMSVAEKQIHNYINGHVRKVVG